MVTCEQMMMQAVSPLSHPLNLSLTGACEWGIPAIPAWWNLRVEILSFCSVMDALF